VLPEAIDGAVEDFVLIEGFQATHALPRHDSGSSATKILQRGAAWAARLSTPQAASTMTEPGVRLMKEEMYGLAARRRRSA
jgi:hypothetical protein